jgi:hypothetical protein
MTTELRVSSCGAVLKTTGHSSFAYFPPARGFHPFLCPRPKDEVHSESDPSGVRRGVEHDGVPNAFGDPRRHDPAAAHASGIGFSGRTGAGGKDGGFKPGVLIQNRQKRWLPFPCIDYADFEFAFHFHTSQTVQLDSDGCPPDGPERLRRSVYLLCFPQATNTIPRKQNSG